MSAFEANDTYAPLIPAPAARRAFTARDAFALWFSLGIRRARCWCRA